VVCELLALLCTGLFAGAAVYVTLVEHPARLKCGTALAIAEFRPSYRRAAVMQATLAGIGCAAALGAWGQGRGWSVLVAGLMLGSVIPFTLIVILPTNKRLLNPGLDPNSTEATTLLARWGKLHTVRTAASGAAFLLLGLHMAGAL
jgi:uncharacterized membrane protein